MKVSERGRLRQCRRKAGRGAPRAPLAGELLFLGCWVIGGKERFTSQLIETVLE